ncbi:MAG: hypothetical protein B6242_06450 [Anaerolineaceae bacterium 4572_78]|nr:MAG: hypothetical protein B6242_06450 [Anaerolineaceae bacterium 4572_78]
MTHTQQKLLIISLIVLSTTAGHLFSMNLKYTSISGDEQWYTYNAVYFLGSVIRGCRAIFGEHATCGVQYPSHHPFLQEVFEQTGMNRYLAGEIDFETFLGVADGLEIDKFETLSRYKLRNPLEIILSRGNLTAITLGMSMWIFGSNYAGFLILQTFIIGLSIAIIFQLGYYFSNAWGGTLAAMIWGFYTFFQLQENVIPQDKQFFFRLSSSEHPLTFFNHSSQVVLGFQPGGSYLNLMPRPEQEGWRVITWDTSNQPESLRDSLRNLFQNSTQFWTINQTIITSMYRIWSTPWRQFPISWRQTFIIIFHQIVILFGLAGLLYWMGYQTEQGVLAWFFAISAIVFTAIHTLIIVEPRHAIPWIPVLIGMAGSLFGNTFARKKSQHYTWWFQVISLKLISVIFLVSMIFMIDVSLIALLFKNLSSNALLTIALSLRLILGLIILTWLIADIDKSNWKWQQLILPVAIFLIPWILIDMRGLVNIRLNGQVLRKEDGYTPRMLKWGGYYNDERNWYRWPLKPSWIQPNMILVFEFTPVQGKNTTLYGDFPMSNTNMYVGPAIEYKGNYRSVWRSRWSPINEWRITRSFDLQGIRYRSQVVMPNGDVITDDLSPDIGRQHGLFRIIAKNIVDLRVKACLDMKKRAFSL